MCTEGLTSQLRVLQAGEPTFPSSIVIILYYKNGEIFGPLALLLGKIELSAQ